MKKTNMVRVSDEVLEALKKYKGGNTYDGALRSLLGLKQTGERHRLGDLEVGMSRIVDGKDYFEDINEMQKKTARLNRIIYLSQIKYGHKYLLKWMKDDKCWLIERKA